MEKKNRKPIRLIIVTGILLIMVTCSLVYAHLGGFSTGKSADIWNNLEHSVAEKI